MHYELSIPAQRGISFRRRCGVEKDSSPPRSSDSLTLWNFQFLDDPFCAWIILDCGPGAESEKASRKADRPQRRYDQGVGGIARGGASHGAKDHRSAPE